MSFPVRVRQILRVLPTMVGIDKQSIVGYLFDYYLLIPSFSPSPISSDFDAPRVKLMYAVQKKLTICLKGML